MLCIRGWDGHTRFRNRDWDTRYLPVKCCVLEAGMDTLDFVIVTGILPTEFMCVPCGAPKCAL